MHAAPAPDRAALPVLVPEAHAIGTIAVIRSLGRAGYPVHACATDRNALGLVSNYAVAGVVSPPYGDAAFLPWLADYVAAHRIAAIVPSEAFLLAIRPVFERYAALLPIPSDATLVYRNLSKAAVLDHLAGDARTARHLPPTLVAEGPEAPAAEAFAAFDLPIFVKADAVDARSPIHASRVIRADSVAAARKAVGELLGNFSRVLAQGFVPGQGTGAYFLVDEHGIAQEFANRCLHEIPHTGGFCSLRESWWNEAMMEDARAKLRELGWKGVAMLEYRWDPRTGELHFIELNARFWAALHLALFAGVDFPRMLLDSFHGRDVQRTSFPVGLQCRLTVHDIGYVASRWRDPAVGMGSKLASVGGWMLRCLDPRIRSDLWFPRDSHLYWRQWGVFLRNALARVRRMGSAANGETAR